MGGDGCPRPIAAVRHGAKSIALAPEGIERSGNQQIGIKHQHPPVTPQAEGVTIEVTQQADALAVAGIPRQAFSPGGLWLHKLQQWMNS